MKKLIFFLAIFVVTTAACNADNNESKTTSSAAKQQAQTDYKSYVEQLKQLSQQYNQMTGQIKDVLKETGVPSFDENTGEIKMEPYSPGTSAGAITTDNQNVHISQTDKDMTVRLDLPGLDRRTVAISIEQQTTLRIKGNRKSSASEEITKEITLPYPAKDQDASAKYEDGVLTVQVKKASVTSKSIPVPLN